MIDMASWHSYPSIFAIGHKAVKEILRDPVLVEEKVDGSQFSFGLFDGGYRARSKSVELNLIAPEKMFAKAVEVVQLLPLRPGWTYRGEYLAKPRHNALAYDRTPRNHIILFDINTGHEEYLSYEEKAAEAERLGLEVVPLLHSGLIEDLGTFRALLDRVSVLGGQKIEGVVVKNYQRFGTDKKILLGKFVSEAFKEVHRKAWGESNPKQGEILERLVQTFKTSARWGKAVQHLREAGALEGSPRDIGRLMAEVQQDVVRECGDEIAQILFKWALPHLKRGIIAGLPEWYKEQLLKQQFEVAL